jgi:hypothetical protein
MSSQYEGLAVFPTSFAIPDDSDARDAASVGVGLEALGDRTAYLKDRVEFSGIRRIRTVASVVSAQALEDLTAGDVVQITNLGLYRFQDTELNTAGDPTIDTPDGPWQFAVTAGGYLVNVNVLNMFRKDQAQCLAVTTAAGKLQYPDIVPMRTVVDDSVSSGTDANLPPDPPGTPLYQSLSVVDTWVTAMSRVVGPLVAGDLVRVTFSCPLIIACASMASARMRVQITYGGDTYSIGGAATYVAKLSTHETPGCTAEHFPVCLTGQHEMQANAATATVVVQLLSHQDQETYASVVTIPNCLHLNVRAIRP